MEKKTLTLGPREWNALLASNADDLANVFKSQTMPSADLYWNIVEHIDRMKAILPGWLASAPQAVADAPKSQAAPELPPAPKPNGAAPKPKRGWPKGKQRKVRAAPGIAQSGVQ